LARRAMVWHSNLIHHEISLKRKRMTMWHLPKGPSSQANFADTKLIKSNTDKPTAPIDGWPYGMDGPMKPPREKVNRPLA
jgi:hypothetical protein